MEEKHINKKITFSIVAVLLIVLVTIGATYAYFSAQAQTEVQTVTTGTLTMGFTNGDIVNATGIVPIADSEIETKATALPFSITNTGNQHMNITIKLTDITIDDALKDIDFRWGLYNPDKQDAAGTEMGIAFGIFKYSENGGEEIIYRDSIIDAGAPTKNYVLRIWIHDDGALQNEMQGKTFSAKVTVTGEAVEYTDESCFAFDSSTGEITGYDGYGYFDDTVGDFVIRELGNCPKDVVIPRTIDGVTVTKIGDYAFDGEVAEYEIENIIIPDSVTTIGGSPLSYNNLTHITIPDSVIVIGQRAFYENSNLISVTIPESVSIMVSSKEEFAGETFAATSLKSVVIPGSLTNTSVYAFGACDTITDIVLMEGITTIGYWLSDSANFETIEIPSSVTSIDEDAFFVSGNLTEIVVRGKNSLADFTDYTGLTTEGGLPEGVNIVFRP